VRERDVEGFSSGRVRVNGVRIRFVFGGDGPPVLLLHGSYEVMDLWRREATDVRGHPLDCGHFVAEEQPELVVSELLAFL
jgi:pimeloyl-ACP methyl ester carboxylesterase